MREVIDDKWIGIEAAAEYLDVNKDSIRNWIKKESGIPAHKIGKQWKFKKSELDEWVKSGKSAKHTLIKLNIKRRKLKKLFMNI